MLHILKKIFGPNPATNYADLMEKGAIILDVRSTSEYKQGHVRKSMNIPLNELSSHLAKLKKDSVIITCCASGIRSASAKNILKSNGFTSVYNGGSWISLQKKIV